MIIGKAATGGFLFGCSLFVEIVCFSLRDLRKGNLMNYILCFSQC